MKSIKLILGMIFIGGTILTSSPKAFGQSTLQVDATTTDVNCFGVDDGTANLIISGGFPPFTILWNFGATTSNLSGMPSGEYSVMVTDNSGATFVKSVTIYGPTEPLTITAVKTNVTIFGQQNGTIDISIYGGSPFKWSTEPYQISWSNGAVTWDQTNLGAGVYTVTATDRVGCQANKTIYISAPFQLVQAPFEDFASSMEDVTEIGVVYPNPSSGEINVSVKDKSINEISIVSVLTGQEVKSLTDLSSSNYVGGLNSGLYLVRYIKNGVLVDSQRLNIVE